MKWFEKSYRRHLLDMHIEDWDPGFLSEFSPEEYYENLKTAKVQSAMIYLQSHVGHCYWPTSSGHMHSAFVGRVDSVKRLIDKCRTNGIDVVGYYSPTLNNWLFDRHPEWRAVEAEGSSERFRKGFCCPNNTDFRKFVLTQIKEMMEYFDLDGMFYDFPMFPCYCYCDSCKERWNKEVGGELPRDKSDSRWALFERKRQAWIGEWAQLLTDTTKSLKPGITVEQNYAQTALPHMHLATAEAVNKACDYCGGDLYDTFETQSFTCKFYHAITRNQPFEFMPGRCEPNLTVHTVSKTHDKLELAIMLTCAHHGANLIIDAIDPIGTMDARVYGLLGEIYSSEKQYEPYLTGKYVADVGVMYALSSRANLQGQNFSHYTGTLNTITTMTRAHIPVGIVTTENLDTIGRYPFIVLSNPNRLSEKMLQAIIEYVENGGTLYFSNADESELFKRFIGGKCIGYTESSQTYVGALNGYESSFGGYGLKYPLPFPYRLPMVQDIEDNDVKAKIVLPYTLPTDKKFASIHSNPPGEVTDLPAIIIRSYGKGRVIWSAAPIECMPTYSYRSIMENFVRCYSGEKIHISTNAPEDVELVCFEDDERRFIQINTVAIHNGDVARNCSPFEICYKMQQIPKSVRLMPEGRSIPFEYVDETVCFKTEPLHIFAMYHIEF